MKTLPYGRQEITDADIDAVVKVLKSDFLTQGPMIGEFENQLGKFLNAKHTIAVSNGTTALHLAALALNVQPGDWVLCTAVTFVASANCIRYCGGDVEFVDIDSKNFCLDFNKLEEKLKKGDRKYKGIVAVDLAGFPIDFEKLRALADKYSLWIIEDACHAIGGQFLNSKDQWVSSGNSQYADISVFSFHPVKHIAMGEGGAITTSDDKLADRMRLLRTHGITKDPKQISHPEQGWYMEMQELGFNYRLADINAALGVSQMQRLDENLKRRREIAKLYDDAFISRGWVFSYDHAKVRHAYHLYVIQVPDRLKLYNHLREKGIYSQVHYIPVCDQPYYLDLYGRSDVPQARSYYEKALSLPMYPGLTDQDVKRVIDTVIGFYA